MTRSLFLFLAVTVLVSGGGAAQAQDGMGLLGETLGGVSEALSGNGSDSGSLSGRLIQIFGLMTVLSLAPGLMVVMTSFTRFVIVLAMLRMALGLNQSPPNMVITSLAMFLTFFVMQPVFQDSWDDGLAPLIEGSITEEQALPRIAQPFHDFMSRNTREADLALFQKFAERNSEAGSDTLPGGGGSRGMDADPAAYVPSDKSELSWSVLVPSFMISELRRAFTIGFLIYLPFIAIDLITASILMGAGMMMLSPVMISLPFKIMFFVLIDGWYMLAGSLIQSYAGG